VRTQADEKTLSSTGRGKCLGKKLTIRIVLRHPYRVQSKFLLQNQDIEPRKPLPRLRGSPKKLLLQFQGGKRLRCSPTPIGSSGAGKAAPLKRIGIALNVR
jgi:hypothetical protein